MKKKIIVFTTLIVLIFTLIGTAFAAKRITSRHSKYDLKGNSNWSIIHEDKDRIVKACYNGGLFGKYCCVVNGAMYTPGIIQAKEILKHEGYITDLVPGKKIPFDAIVHTYLVLLNKDGNYVYTLASEAFYNKGKFLADDDYPENYKDLSKFERMQKLDSVADKISGLPVIE